MCRSTIWFLYCQWFLNMIIRYQHIPLMQTFFALILLELFLMGSGRFLEFGPLTLRMIFFILAIALSFFMYLMHLQIKKYVLWFVLVQLSLLSFSSFVGILNGANISLVLEDIKPLLYFFMILPFAVFIKNYQSIILVVNIIKFSSFLMMLFYLIFISLLYFSFINFDAIYSLVSEGSDDIMFRGAGSDEPGFFYKGFLYLNVGFIFFIFSPKKLDKVVAFFLFISILLTFTRGFIVALALSFIYLFLVEIKNKKSFFALVSIVLLIFILIPYYMTFVGERSESDIMRIIQIRQVIENISVVSLLIGHGFGVGIPIRPVHLEIAYLEIFHKQGLMGLLFWFLIIWMITKQYLTIKYKNHIVKSFFLSSVFVFMQSLTNPFINNPIGLAMVLVTLVSLIYIKNNEKEIYE